MKRSNTFRNAGWLAVAGLLSVALVAPVSALANTGHQSGTDISWDNPQYFSEKECLDVQLAPGQVLWHFIQNGVEGDYADDEGTLTATFASKGMVEETSYKFTSGGVFMWNIITGHDTLKSFSSDIESEGQLNLSHICYGPKEEESQPVESEDVSQPVESEDVSQPVESEDVSQPVESEDVSQPVESEDVSQPVESDGPSGSVEALTGTPSVTPPPTDLGSSTSTPTNDSWRLVLVAMAALLASVLVMTPATRRTRR